MITDAQVGRVPAPEVDAAIQIDGLVVNYGRKRAVDGLSLTVPRGTVYGFLGRTWPTIGRTQACTWAKVLRSRTFLSA